jgi:MoxR-like ATPase
MAMIAVDQLPADPLDALRALARFDTELSKLRFDTIEAARCAGATWDQVGEALGMSRQAAWEHYTRSIRARLAASTSTSELSDDEAEQLAVDEVKAARRQRRGA